MSEYMRIQVTADVVRFIKDNNIKDLDELIRLAKIGMVTEKYVVPAIEKTKLHLEKELEERN